MRGKTRGIVAVEDRGEHFERVGIDIVFDVAQHGHLVRHDEYRQLGLGAQREAADSACSIDRLLARGQGSRRRP